LIDQTPFHTSCSWLLGDHLGSTSMVADASGVMVSEVRYSAFGETRYQNGTLTTDYLYTGQRQEAEIGLYYYVARWYDPAIGRFIQADSIVPDPASAVGFDRYAYVNNNPLNSVDPTGHGGKGEDPLDVDHGDDNSSQWVNRIVFNIGTAIGGAFNDIGQQMAKTSEITIPVVIPKNFSNISEAGTIVRYTISPTQIRSVGRGLGDISTGPVVLIGWGVNLLPSALENLSEGAHLDEWIADAQIDSAGFWISEGAGWISGLLFLETANPLPILSSKITTDVVIGIGYDYLVDKYGIRDLFTEMNGYLLNPAIDTYHIPEPVPVPSPQFPQITPHPSNGGIGNHIYPLLN